MQKILFLVLISIIFAQEYPKGKDIPQITKAKWVSDLIELAKNRVTEYRTNYPSICIYYDGNKWITDDVNLHYALFNGRDIYDYSSGCGSRYIINIEPITGEEMIFKCNDVSNDFTRLKEGEPRIAMLSYSTKGSAVSSLTEKVVNATKIANENQDKFGQDALLASEVLLKLSAPRGVKVQNKEAE